MNKMVVWSDGRSWMVTYSGPHATEVRRLFGTDTLPTSRTASADKKEVVEILRALNPGVEVR
jgi:hypothetical protein